MRYTIKAFFASTVSGRTHIEHYVWSFSSAGLACAEPLFHKRYVFGMRIEENSILAPFTTFKIGGTADFFCRIRSLEDLKKALAFASEKHIPFFVLGGGSNMLIADSGFRGLVVKIALRGVRLEQIDRNTVHYTGASGEIWDDFVEGAVTAGYCGLENLSGIPGTVGAAPVQNIGAYGTEIADTLVSVAVYDTLTGKEKTLSTRACCLGYRDSIFKKEKGKRYIILSVTCALRKKCQPDISYKDLKTYFDGVAPSTITTRALRRAVLHIRAGKFPDLTQIGTAGSFFQNPIITHAHYAKLIKKYPDIPSFPALRGKVKIPAGWLIEHVARAKGMRHGAVGCSPKQALVVVNYGGATAQEVLDFTETICKVVLEQTGIALQKEVQLLVSSDEHN